MSAASAAALQRPDLGRPGFLGRAELAQFQSQVLVGNPLGDPSLREVPIYLPPGHERGERFPLVLVLAGFTGRGHKYLEPDPWWPSLAQRFDRAVGEGRCPPAILCFPDCFTRLGGSQYMDSSATGNYCTHLWDELVPALEAALPVEVGRLGAVGKSSGGFGVLHALFERPGRLRAAASISGDCCFELSLASEFPTALKVLQAHNGDPQQFLASFQDNPKLSSDGHALLNVMAMSACYAPNPASPLGFDLPFELERCERLAPVWKRFLAFDPLTRVESPADAAALKAPRFLHLECGLRDEFHLQWGLRRLVKRLKELDIPHRHVEHEGSHRNIDSRYDLLLPELIMALQ